MMSLSHCQPRVWSDYIGNISSVSFSLAFLTNMSEKRTSASPTAIQVKNRHKTIGIEEKLHIIFQHQKVNELLIYAIVLDSIIVAYVQFVIMLTELKKVLSEELKCLFV
jgi:hypothetical protein